jgi:hypothetical protein
MAAENLSPSCCRLSFNRFSIRCSLPTAFAIFMSKSLPRSTLDVHLVGCRRANLRCPCVVSPIYVKHIYLRLMLLDVLGAKSLYRFSPDPEHRVDFFLLVSSGRCIEYGESYDQMAESKVSNEPMRFLQDLLGKTLHITVADGRLFTGMHCPEDGLLSRRC